MFKKGEIFDIYERIIGTSEWKYVIREKLTSFRRIKYSSIGDIEYWIYIGHKYKFRTSLCRGITLTSLNLKNDMEYKAVKIHFLDSLEVK